MILGGLDLRNYCVIERLPTSKEFLHLRQLVDWPNLNKATVEQALNASLYSICIEFNNETVGIGRVVGDGSLYFYIQDLIIHPKHQRRGLGKNILEKLMSYIDENSVSGSFIGLMSAKRKEDFYKKFGFVERPNEIYGAGMCIHK